MTFGIIQNEKILKSCPYAHLTYSTHNTETVIRLFNILVIAVKKNRKKYSTLSIKDHSHIKKWQLNFCPVFNFLFII